MALKMPGPVALAPSQIFYLNIRVPKDLTTALRGTKVTLPVDGHVVTVTIGDKVVASLRTKETSEARKRFNRAFDALDRHFEAVRAGPKPLGDEQIVALAGDAYRDFVDKVRPKLGLGTFEASRAAHEEAVQGFCLGDPLENIIGGLAELPRDQAEELAVLQLPNGPELWAWSQGRDIKHVAFEVTYNEALEHLFGAQADVVVARHQLCVDNATRLKLLKQIGRGVIAGTARLKQLSEGDYSPDRYLAKFPTFDREPRVTVAILFERWRHSNEGVVEASTIRRYTPSLKSLVAFVKDKDVRRIDQDDIWGWAEHRRDVDGIAPSTVNGNDLVAASSVFAFATTRDGKRLRPDNPVTGVKLLVPKAKPTRDRAFRAGEVSAILTLARGVRIEGTYPKAAASRRWAPWICAYSGARIQEPCWLEKQHFWQDEETGIWVMRFVRTKTDLGRTVPLHDALIEEGMLDFVRTAPDGLLFVGDRPRKGENLARTIQEQRASQIAEWIGEHVKLDQGVDPNHGWRHSFISRGTGKMEARVLHAISGHNQKRSAADGYFHATIAEMKAGLDRFLPYKI